MELDRLKLLRSKMKEHDVQALIVPTSDFHDTEYVSDYFAARKHFSGFTGSAGTLVVYPDAAGLWTDGRYFIQAAHELEGSGIDLMKMGMPGTPGIAQDILAHLKSGQRVAFDGRCVSMQDFEAYKKAFEAHGLDMVSDLDLAGEAWPDRPALPASRTFAYDEQYTGENAADKLTRVRKAIREKGADAHITNKIDDAAWLFNLRAHDIPSFPAALAYALITPEKACIYLDDSRLDDSSRRNLKDMGVTIRPYEAIVDDAMALEGKVLLDPAHINSRIAQAVSHPLWADNPIQLMKACKNPTEVAGAYQAHRKDGAAVVKFWKWLEDEMAQGRVVTEISAAARLQGFRQELPGYVEDSFDTIAAYGPNAAMAHYHPDEEHPTVLKDQGLFLVDSGGHYLEGTTDITRTFVMGDLSEEERRAFTLVLIGHIDLARAVFPHGVRGLNLDILARQALWKEGLDYNHGTGHGVGALLSVHEAPNGIRWKVVPERNDSCVLEVGMITSDEPGFYEEGKFGIRHENLLVVTPAFESEYGQYLKQDALTRVPFDIRGLDLSLMNDEQIDWLNAYHKQVEEDLRDLLDPETFAWLQTRTAPVSKDR